MRAFVVASFIAVMLMLFVAATVEPEGQHAEAAVQTGLMVEATCPCGLESHAHANLIANYEAETEGETCVLKLPIRTAQGESKHSDSTMSRKFGDNEEATRHDGLRPGTVLKLPYYAVGQRVDSNSAATTRGRFAAGVLA